MSLKAPEMAAEMPVENPSEEAENPAEQRSRARLSPLRTWGHAEKPRSAEARYCLDLITNYLEKEGCRLRGLEREGCMLAEEAASAPVYDGWQTVVRWAAAKRACAESELRKVQRMRCFVRSLAAWDEAPMTQISAMTTDETGRPRRREEMPPTADDKDDIVDC